MRHKRGNRERSLLVAYLFFHAQSTQSAHNNTHTAEPPLRDQERIEDAAALFEPAAGGRAAGRVRTLHRWTPSAPDVSLAAHTHAHAHIYRSSILPAAGGQSLRVGSATFVPKGEGSSAAGGEENVVRQDGVWYGPEAILPWDVVYNDKRVRFNGVVCLQGKVG